MHPSSPTPPKAQAANMALGQGTRINAEISREALKWTIVGVEKAGPASVTPLVGRSASRVMTTNCRPISAPADDQIEAFPMLQFGHGGASSLYQRIIMGKGISVEGEAWARGRG